MGRRTRSSAAAFPAASSSTAGIVSPRTDDEAPIRPECERAYKAIERGQTAKAQKIVNNLFSRHGQSLAVLHHIQGMIYSELANQTTDSSAKLKQLENAAKSALRAAALSPNSVEFALCYSVALFDVAWRGGDCTLYWEIVDECTRGSAIENPRDPLTDTLRQDPNDSRNLTPELRIAVVKEDLDSLKTKCEIMSTLELLKGTTDPERNTLEQKLVEIELSEDFTRGGEFRKNDPKREQESLYPITMSMRARSESLKCKHLDLSKLEAKDSKLRRMRSFWVTMSPEDKRAFMEVRTDELEQYIESFKSAFGKNMLEDALSLVAKDNQWRCWECGICKERFRDCKQCEKHFANVHVELAPVLLDLLPEELDKISADWLLNVDWRPIDTAAAIAIVLSISNFTLDEFVGEFKRWPLVTDPERENILKDIHDMFHRLHQRRCLSTSHAYFVLTYMQLALLDAFPITRLRDCELLRSPQCICFLDVEQLMEVAKFLQRLLNATGSHEISEVKRDDIRIKEKVRFCPESSNLILEGKSLERELDEYEGQFCDELPCDDVFLSWLLEELPVVDEQIELQRLLQEDRKLTTSGVIESLSKEFDHLQTIVTKKCELLCFREALTIMKTMCENEDRRRKQVLEFKSQTYAFMRNAKTMLCVISKIVEKASFLYVDMSGYEGLSGSDVDPASVISFLSHQFETIRDENRIRDNFLRLYTCVIEVILVLGRSTTISVCRADAIILHCLERMRQIKHNLALLSAYDYRSIIVPLMKSFMQERLKLLINKASTESCGNPIKQENGLDPKQGA